MEEIKRRTLVVRIFPHASSCLRLVRALAVQMHENWIEAIRYLNMEPLREQKKDLLRQIGEAARSPPLSASLSRGRGLNRRPLPLHSIPAHRIRGPEIFLQNLTSTTANQPEPKKSSARRIAASRANSAKSRGPVTPEGKERSSKNALKHGLASETIVLTTEDWPNYPQCRDTFIQRFQPAGDVELDLVEEMIATRWRQQRMWAIESAVLDDEIAARRADVDQTCSAIRPDVRTALAFTKLADESRALPLIGRYESRYARQFHRALKVLKELQANRPSAPAPSELTTDNRQTDN